MFNFIEDKEVETDLEAWTGFSVGERVQHINKGAHGGNGAIISDCLGTVKGFNYHGIDWNGSNCVTVTVIWDSPLTPNSKCETEIRHFLLRKGIGGQ